MIIDPINLIHAGIDYPVADIVKLICIFAVWLHIRAGVSRSVANKILKAIQIIFSFALRSIEIALLAAGVSVKLADIQVPQDIRTAYQHYHTEPDIIRTACCPKCYTSYSTHPIPWRCHWRASPRSYPCNTELWESRNTQKGPKWIPKRLYTTQSFDSWLAFFLSRQVIEDNLIDTFRHHQDRPPIFGGYMHDIQDSPAWADLTASGTPYGLIFGTYVDWFNPFTNKIGGANVSCGAIVLYCLNLPPHLRYRPENTFIIGLMPSPNLPNPTTISHLLNPVIDAILAYSAPGKHIPTFYHPDCTEVQVKACTPFVADLEASRKVSGFLTHSATCYCSFCLSTSKQINDLNIHTWRLRNGAEVREQANTWLHLTTTKARETQATLTGVRWTSLHRLPYWDPVKHVVLGFMHNWLEGILAHHLRSLWGIGRDQKDAKRVKEIEEEEGYSESDLSESANELNDLSPPPSPSPSAASNSDDSSSSTPTITDQRHIYQFDDDMEDDSDSDQEYVPPSGPDIGGYLPFDFPDAQLTAIRDCIHNISLPTWTLRPPSNLGEPKHGTLKAREYLMLFSCVFPLIIPEFWHTVDATDFDRKHFLCFYHLVAATNIISSYKTSNADADNYTHHYIQYRAGIQELFSYRPLKPNHHYAMHNAALLKYWGPLASFSEFPGERLNGLLQKTKTNGRLGKDHILLITGKSLC